MFDLRQPALRLPLIVGVSLAVGAVAGQLAGLATGVVCLVITGFVLEIAFWIWLLGDFRR